MIQTMKKPGAATIKIGDKLIPANIHVSDIKKGHRISTCFESLSSSGASKSKLL